MAQPSSHKESLHTSAQVLNTMQFTHLFYLLLKVAGIGIAVSICRLIILIIANHINPRLKPFLLFGHRNGTFRLLKGFIEAITISVLLYIGLPWYAIVALTLISTYLLRAIYVYLF